MLQSLRSMVGSLIAAPVLIAVAMFFVLGSADDALTPTVLLAAPLLLGAAVHATIETVGYRPAPIAPGTPRERAETTSAEQYQSTTILRFALSESVLVVSLAAAFVVTEGGYLLLLVGAVVSVLLMLVHCWPWERPLARTQAGLEREGGEAYLREAYGLPPADGGGAIRRL